MKNHTVLKNKIILLPIILSGILFLPALNLTGIAEAKVYPYAAREEVYSSPDGLSTTSYICDSGDNANNTAHLCIPTTAFTVNSIEGTCNKAGFEKTPIKVGDAVYCLPTPGLEAGVSGLVCPTGSTPIYQKTGIWTLITTGESAVATNCLKTGVVQSLCPRESQILVGDVYQGCSVAPSSIIGANGSTSIGSSCDAAYKPNLDGSCKPGDYVTTCPGKGNLCVTPLVPGGEKITQTLHEYKTKYTIPCQPLAGGQCSDEQTPAGYIARLYQFGLMIVGLFAFGGIVYGALKYILSAGSMADQSDAKDQITQAVLGLMLLLGSFLILYTINPDITNLRNPNLEVIQIKNIIKAGEADNTGGQRIPTTGGAGSSDDLCKLAVNSQISLNVNADLNDSGNGTLFDLSGTKLPSGNQSASKCISCKDNAALGSNGTCACTSPFQKYNGECLKLCLPGETSGCIPNMVTANPITNIGAPGGEIIGNKTTPIPQAP